MKKNILFFFIIFTIAVKAQINLVPNFSFETYDTCPNSADQVQYSLGWSKYSDTLSTPDYYNSCSSPSSAGVPQSFYLYQPDPRNCGAYVGLGTWSYTGNNDREQIGIQLTQPLIVGQKYFISFKTVMGGTGDGSFYYESPSNNTCLRLSTIPYSPANPAPIDNFAHLRSVGIINDTANWVRISGSIIADSVYNYAVLGNFFDDNNTDTLTLNCGSCVNSYSYYLFDEICVSTDSLLCNGGIDALPCTLSVSELGNDNSFSLYPNPTNSFFTIKNNFLSSFDVYIYNSLGQEVYFKHKADSDLELDFSNYNNGMYYINITTSDRRFSYKLLKQ